MKLNLGCGDDYREGYINIDRIVMPKLDMQHDLEDIPLPFEDNSVDHTYASHVLEHIRNYMPLVEDLHRISKPGASMEIVVPYYKYEGTFRDPTHVSFFTEHSFDYFKDGVKFSHYSPARFDVLSVEKGVKHYSSVRNTQKKIIGVIPNVLRPVLDMFLWNMYTEIKYDLRVVK